MPTQETQGSMGLIPGLGRSPGGGIGNPLQYPCLEDPTSRGAWRAAVRGVTKSRAWPSMSTHARVGSGGFCRCVPCQWALLLPALTAALCLRPEHLPEWCPTSRDLKMAALGDLSHIPKRLAASSSPGCVWTSHCHSDPLLLNDYVCVNDSAFLLGKRPNLSFLFWFSVNDYV